MNKSKIFFMIGVLMILVAIIFIMFAMNHPEMSFVGGNIVAYSIYAVYAIIAILMFVMAGVQKRK